MTAEVPLSRRAFTTRLAAGAILTVPGLGVASALPRPEGKVASIEPRGVLIGECSLPGETRKDDVVPAHANGIQVSRDRWLLLYATRGWRGVDDDRSIVYQLRKDSPDGPVIKEGMCARAGEWEPFGPGKTPGEGKIYFKQHGHPVVFGVPHGAVIDGKAAPHANVFVAKWRITGRILDKASAGLIHGSVDKELMRRTIGVEWMQFRLNERGDDIEIIQPVRQLRQKGFEDGPAFCSGAKIVWMNQTFTPAVPFNRACTEWADCNHFDGGRVAALKYRFDPKLGRYEWVELGPFLSDKGHDLFEASLAQVGGRWVIAARQAGHRGIAWVRTDDPFSQLPRPVYPAEPGSNAPLTAFTWADGVLRVFTGDPSVSPHRNARDPLYCWDVDPDDGFTCSNRRVIFDSVKAGLPIRKAASPKIDMCKLLPPQGRTQLILFRVSVRSYNHPYTGSAGKPTGIPVINQDEKACSAVYYARVTYREELPAAWQFGPAK
jgi:hypothetical protein